MAHVYTQESASDHCNSTLYVHEVASYKPLECLGDGIIRHLVVEALFIRYPDLASGGLTVSCHSVGDAARANLYLKIFRDHIVRNSTISYLT